MDPPVCTNLRIPTGCPLYIISYNSRINHKCQRGAPYDGWWCPLCKKNFSARAESSSLAWKLLWQVCPLPHLARPQMSSELNKITTTSITTTFIVMSVINRPPMLWCLAGVAHEMICMWGDGRGKDSQLGVKSESKAETILRQWGEEGASSTLFLQTISEREGGRTPVVGMAHYWAHLSLPEPRQSSHLRAHNFKNHPSPPYISPSTEAINRMLVAALEW